jgi:hypothetical protein
MISQDLKSDSQDSGNGFVPAGARCAACYFHIWDFRDPDEICSPAKFSARKALTHASEGQRPGFRNPINVVRREKAQETFAL